ncbi:hypothetical protein PITCH_A350054 [uncultured Desulfobacterium sp.]|uniref:DUF2229 domain-containing protein n=1 Tax=uncultured Desulfobacterium sp. TaxID=201089 RepID=A0A445MZF9_9BACT|nr:hypothetical protein PITCH_A350054 [uncultured Desulfobacterium sp.]
MKVGMAGELLFFEWMSELKGRLSQLAPEIEWIHAPSAGAGQQLLIDADSCYPFKQMVRSSVSLLSDVDVLLAPRIIAMDGFLVCPNFRALPDIVLMNRARLGLNKETHVFTPVVDIDQGHQLEKLAAGIYRDMFGKDPMSCGEKNFSADGQSMAMKDRDLSKSIALIGHPYVLEDSCLNNGVPDILRLNGIDIVYAQWIDFNELSNLAASFDYYAKRLYWRSARELLGAFIYFSRIRPAAGIIHLAPFNCGIDALMRVELTGLRKRMADAPPYMVVVCDEHTQRDHVVTRLEAFLDIVNGVKIK